MLNQMNICLMWNEVFIQFCDELIKMFPDSPAAKIKMQFQISKIIKNETFLVMFLENFKDHKEELMNADEDYFFGSGDIQFMKKLELTKYYKMSSEENKKIIWQYMHTLFLLAEKHEV